MRNHPIHSIRIDVLVVVFSYVLIAEGFAADQIPTTQVSNHFNVRSFGAVGDGKLLDTEAVNRAIDAASAMGGGTVLIPAGSYLCTSIHLKSNITLQLDAGAVIVAATQSDAVKYDPLEPNPFDGFQDSAHSHWHDSLIWGEGLENVSVIGRGRIWGRGLVKSLKRPEDGADKSIALKSCRNVLIRDVTIAHGGHFAVLLTGVDNVTIDNLTIDTNRDGIDIDSCRDVRISNCAVNAPFDDAICLKSSFALGEARATENVVIQNCVTTGYDEGTLLDGTRQRNDPKVQQSGPASRIKLGTESVGGFRNIAITNCVLEYCRGLALESVDGGILEDVTISNVTMRDIFDCPIFLRLGARLRGGSKIGELRRVTISSVNCYGSTMRYPLIIAGLPGHNVQSISLNELKFVCKGGGSKQDAMTEPIESARSYPDPRMFGTVPAYALYARHVNDLQLHNVSFRILQDEQRPALTLDDVAEMEVSGLKAQHTKDVPIFKLNNVLDFSVDRCKDVPNLHRERADQEIIRGLSDFAGSAPSTTRMTD